MGWCFLQWTNQPMPNFPTLEECTDDKQECSNIQNSPEKASTRYRGSLTLRSPHTRRNRWTGPESAGMPGNDCKNQPLRQGPELNTPNCSSESTDNGKALRSGSWAILIIPHFLLCISPRLRMYITSRAQGFISRDRQCAGPGESSGAVLGPQNHLWALSWTTPGGSQWFYPLGWRSFSWSPT